MLTIWMELLGLLKYGLALLDKWDIICVSERVLVQISRPVVVPIILNVKSSWSQWDWINLNSHNRIREFQLLHITVNIEYWPCHKFSHYAWQKMWSTLSFACQAFGCPSLLSICSKIICLFKNCSVCLSYWFVEVPNILWI